MGESQLTFTIDLAAISGQSRRARRQRVPRSLGLRRRDSRCRPASSSARTPIGASLMIMVCRGCTSRGDSAEIAAAFAEHQMPDGMTAEIIGAYRELGSPRSRSVLRPPPKISPTPPSPVSRTASSISAVMRRLLDAVRRLLGVVVERAGDGLPGPAADRSRPTWRLPWSCRNSSTRKRPG